MKLTKLQLRKMILQELTISIGSFMEEDMVGHDDDVDMPAPIDGGSHTLGPVPNAITQNRSGMGSISEDWEDEDPHDAPPAGAPGMKLRPRRLEVDEVIDDVIVSLESAPDQMAKEDVIALLQHIANIYLGG